MSWEPEGGHSEEGEANCVLLLSRLLPNKLGLRTDLWDHGGGLDKERKR